SPTGDRRSPLVAGPFAIQRDQGLRESDRSTTRGRARADGTMEMSRTRKWVRFGIAALLAQGACTGILGIEKMDYAASPDSGGVSDEAGHGPSNADAGCPTDQTLCGDVCVDLFGDPTHCGACATACPSNLACAAGHCLNPHYLSPQGND